MRPRGPNGRRPQVREVTPSRSARPPPAASGSAGQFNKPEKKQRDGDEALSLGTPSD